MRIETIFLDIDGCIADFEKRYIELYGITPKEADTKGRFKDDFKHFIETGQFATLDPMPDAVELLKYIDSLDIPKFILGSTAYEKVHVEVSRQKEIWLNDMDIDYPPIFVPGKRLKAQYAKPNSVLIDDTKSNIDQWNAKGGISILHTSAKSTIQQLRDILLS